MRARAGWQERRAQQTCALRSSAPAEAPCDPVSQLRVLEPRYLGSLYPLFVEEAAIPGRTAPPPLREPRRSVRTLTRAPAGRPTSGPSGGPACPLNRQRPVGLCAGRDDFFDFHASTQCSTAGMGLSSADIVELTALGLTLFRAEPAWSPQQRQGLAFVRQTAGRQTQGRSTVGRSYPILT